jgi:positive regulator of sigma E activity
MRIQNLIVREIMMDNSSNIIEIGTITKILMNSYEISIPKKGSCKKCGMCLISPSDSTNMRVLASSDQKANLNDKVRVEISHKNSLLYPFIVYIIPILLLLFGYFIGADKSVFAFSENIEINGIIFGLIFLMLGFLSAYIFGKFVNTDEPTAKIIEVLN